MKRGKVGLVRMLLMVVLVAAPVVLVQAADQSTGILTAPNTCRCEVTCSPGKSGDYPAANAGFYSLLCIAFIWAATATGYVIHCELALRRERAAVASAAAASLQEWRGTPTADSYAEGHLSGPSAYLPGSYAASRIVGVQKPSA